MKDPRRRKNVVVRMTPRQGAALKRWLARTAMEAPDSMAGQLYSVLFAIGPAMWEAGWDENADGEWVHDGKDRP